jgi:hypothetical protein
MAYSEAVLYRLRDRLVRYRSEQRTGGRKKKWEVISKEIVNAESVSDGLLTSEPSDRALGEALRRFCAGLQRLSAERLDAVQAFLIEKEYLRPEDLQDAEVPFNIVAALNQYFGVPAEGISERRRPALCGTFESARRDGAGRYEHATLVVAADQEGRIRVEDTLRTVIAPSLPKGEEEPRRLLRVATACTVRWEGWLVETPKRQVFAFVRQADLEEPGLYTVLFDDSHLRAGEPASAMIVLKQTEFAGIHPYLKFLTVTKQDKPESVRAGMLSWVDHNTFEYSRQKGLDDEF